MEEGRDAPSLSPLVYNEAGFKSEINNLCLIAVLLRDPDPKKEPSKICADSALIFHS